MGNIRRQRLIGENGFNPTMLSFYNQPNTAGGGASQNWRIKCRRRKEFGAAPPCRAGLSPLWKRLVQPTDRNDQHAIDSGDRQRT
jgi:hypothetical protein